MADQSQRVQASRVTAVAIVVDFCLILALGLVLLFLFLYGVPYERGFFCNDDTIRLPYKSDTVRPTLLGVFAVGIPTLLVLGCEAFEARQDEARRRRRVALGRWSLPEWAAFAVWTTATFLFGMGAQLLIVMVAKYSVGRLRPNFISVCRPDYHCAAAALSAPPLYVAGFNCTGEDAALIDDGRQSFPSGHASASFFAAVFAVMFLEKRFSWGRSARLPKAFFQLVLVTAAWLTALSRVTDHKHHPSDVAVGILIGCVAAWITVEYILCIHKRDEEAAGDVSFMPSVSAKHVSSIVPATV